MSIEVARSADDNNTMVEPAPTRETQIDSDNDEANVEAGAEANVDAGAGAEAEAEAEAIPAPSDDEGVEVVMDSGGTEIVMDRHDQNVFRAPHPVRPRAMHAPHGPPPPHVKSSGSYGYPPHGSSEYGRPYPVPYAPSGSFDHGSYEQHASASASASASTSHFSPHVQYPHPGTRHPEDVNVISPHHGTHNGGEHGGPPTTSSPRRHGHYQYPPTSPVARPTGAAASPPRRNYAMRRLEGPYSMATRGNSQDGAWNRHGPPSTVADRSRPPLVAESFDSEHYSSRASHPSHPSTPNAPHYGGGPPPPASQHPHQHPHQHLHLHQHQQYPEPSHTGSFYNGSFGGSFDSPAAPPPPPPHFDDYRYYGHHGSPQRPPESPYSPYQSAAAPPPPPPPSSSSYHGYSPAGGYPYDPYSPHPDYGHHRSSYEEDRHYMGDQYHPHHHPPHHHHHHPNTVTPNSKNGGGTTNKDVASHLPKAAHEIDFDVTDPPMELLTPPSKIPLCDSPADVNTYDVLCGRGGGTNSQVGNRRFRKLVQDFQPIYLLARRKEKPLLARTIVLIIRKRGGRFLKKDEETGELYEVGDAKAEAKTSQALREGLDVRATKTAASDLLDKKKKTKKGSNSSTTNSKKEDSDDDDDDDEKMDDASETMSMSNNKRTKERSSSPSSSSKAPQSPPSLPRLSLDEKPPRAPSPDQLQFRKRRRMRSADAADETDVAVTAGCGGEFQDKFFSDFCPPRAEIGRATSPVMNAHSQQHHPHHHQHHHHRHHQMEMGSTTPTRSNSKYDDEDDDIRAEASAQAAASRGCAGIAMDMVTGAATGSFCLGPRSWR